MAQNTIEQMYIQLYGQIEPNESFQKDFKSGVRNVGQFSEDSAGNLILNPVTTSVLKDDFVPDSKTKIKKVNFDLNIAIERSQTYSEDLTEKRFENFLKWIAENSEVFSKLATLNTERSEETFVTKSDVVSKILLTPYNLNDSWSFYATYIRGAVYMMSFRKDTSVQGGYKLSNWGHKFEQYMCGENITEGICPNEQYRIVLTSKLGPYDVLYHKAVDCVKSGTISGQKKLSDYVKLYQTTYTYKPDSTNYFERVKAFNWVVPMVMGGVDETIAGFTNKQSHVKEVRLYTEEDLKEMGKGHWNLDKNFTFAVDFLKFVKEKTKSIPGEVFCFERKNQNSVTCRKGEKKFVPDWFVKKLETSGVEKLETSVVEEMETSDLDF